MKKLRTLLLFAATILAAQSSAQLTDPDEYHRLQIGPGTNWYFDNDTIRINRLHIDNKFGIDSTGNIFYYDNAAPAAGTMLVGNGTKFNDLPRGTAGQVFQVNDAGTDVLWRTLSIAGSDISGLTEFEVLVGASDGSATSYPTFLYGDEFGGNALTLTGTDPRIDISEGSMAGSYESEGIFLTNGTGAAMDIQYDKMRLVDDDNGSVSIFKTDDNSGTAYSLYLPPTQATIPGSYPSNDAAGNLTWVAHTGYCVQICGGQFNPADANTYYFGINPQSSGSTANVNRLYILQPGTITSATIVLDNSGTLGSTETGTIVIRKNNSTDYTISAAVANDARPKVYTNTSLTIPVVAGDYIEIKWTTPTWATNPTAVRLQGVVNIK